MTVAELIALLRELPQDAPVMMAFPSGDYWGTVATMPIGAVGQGAVLETSTPGVCAVDPDGELTQDSPVILGVAS